MKNPAAQIVAIILVINICFFIVGLYLCAKRFEKDEQYILKLMDRVAALEKQIQK